MGDTVKNLKLLREIGLEEWFLYSDKLQLFFTWFGENITAENILQESDIREYEELVEANLALEPNQLEHQAKRFDTELADIRNYEPEMQRLQSELEFSTQVESALDELIEDVKSTHVKIQQQINATEVKRKRNKLEEDVIVPKCMQRAKDVQDAQQENIQKTKELHRFYATDHLSPVFIHQMRMSQVYENCDSFVKHLELYLQNNFKVENVADIDVQNESTGYEQQVAADLEVIKAKIFKSNLELARQQIKLAGQKSLNSLVAHIKVPLGTAALEKETAELRQKNEEYYSMQMEASLDSLTSILHNLAGLEVETAAFDNTQSKLNRAVERLNQLRTIHSVVSDELMNAELLWLLMQVDIDKLRQRTTWHILEQYQSDNIAALLRIDQMRQACKMPPELISENYLIPLKNLLASQLGESAAAVDQESFQLYDKLLQHIRDSLATLGGNMNKRVVSQIEDITKKENRLRRFLQNGPVAKTVLYDVDKKNTIFNIKTELKQIEHDISDFKTGYVKKYSEPMQKDRLWQAKQLLWVWFLTEPKTVLRALKCVQAAAKEHAARGPNRTTKAVSGIQRRE